LYTKHEIGYYWI